MQPIKRLERKIAVVTGASRGIGRATAVRLARDGALVIAHYARNHSACREVIDQITESGGRAIPIAADLSTLEGIETFYSALDRELSSINGRPDFDVLVNNAGTALAASVDATTENDFDAVFAINAKAPFFMVQQALLRIRDGGRIINLSSALSRFAAPDYTAYSMTKAALDTMTRALARQLGSRGITVNAIGPGIIDTEMNEQMLATPEGRAFASSIAVLGRAGRPDEIANVAAFLASDDSAWITGSYIDASGGSLLGTA